MRRLVSLLRFPMGALWLIALLMCGRTVATAQEAGAVGGRPVADVPTGTGVFIWWQPDDPAAVTEDDLRRISTELGATWVRFFILRTPTDAGPGAYDFTGYHSLLKMLRQYHLRPMMILGGDFDRPSIRTQEELDAFMRWAAAAVHYVVDVEQVEDGIWESWNEPNSALTEDWWSAEDYVAWARQLAEEVFSQYPNQCLVGPSTGGTGDTDINALPWLEACFKAGLLRYWSAVSVHPYATLAPGVTPELLDDAYRTLRNLIDYYAPQGREIPIISTEQGDASDFNPWAWNRETEGSQATHVARLSILNRANGVALNMYYDWRDHAVKGWQGDEWWAGRCGLLRGPEDPRDGEDRKPALIALQTFIRWLGDSRPAGRIVMGGKTHVLRFEAGAGSIYATWTIAKGGARGARLPLPCGAYSVLSHLGDWIEDLDVPDVGGAEMDLDDSPKYIVPRAALLPQPAVPDGLGR